jgi:hypothetical protein
MARLIKAKIDTIFSSKVVQLTQDLSQRSKCIVVTENNNACPNCIYDAQTNASSGRYRPGGPTPFTGKVCPVCKGKGKVVTVVQLQIPANVRWGAKPPQLDVPEPEGFVPIGFIKIKMEMKYYNTVYGATYFLIDGIRCSHFDRQLKRRGLLSYVLCECMLKIDK